MVGKIKKKTVPYDGISADLVHCLREIVRRAVMTLAALRDPDARYMGMASMPVEVIRDVQDAYGYSSASVRNFAPSPQEVAQMEIVLPWLAWVRREEGERACRRILAWAMGAALWRLGQREGCSDRTILNRIDRSICNIARHQTGVNIDIEVLDEPYKGAEYAMIYDKSPGPHGGAVTIRKVYVGGVGYVMGGKRVRDGRDKFDLERMSA